MHNERTNSSVNLVPRCSREPSLFVLIQIKNNQQPLDLYLDWLAGWLVGWGPILFTFCSAIWLKCRIRGGGRGETRIGPNFWGLQVGVVRGKCSSCEVAYPYCSSIIFFQVMIFFGLCNLIQKRGQHGNQWVWIHPVLHVLLRYLEIHQ